MLKSSLILAIAAFALATAGTSVSEASYAEQLSLTPNRGDTGWERATTSAVAENGDILVAGDHGTDDVLELSAAYVLRLRPDGRRAVFGTNGLSRLPENLLGPHRVSDIAVDRDGRILVFGWNETPILGDDNQDLLLRPFVIRLTTTGAVDSTYGEGGVAWLPGNNADQSGRSPFGFAVDAAGATYVPIDGLGACDSKRFCVMKLDSNGRLDESFAWSGFARLTLGKKFGQHSLRRIITLGNGRLAAVGQGWRKNSHDRVGVVVFRSNGSVMRRSWGSIPVPVASNSWVDVTSAVTTRSRIVVGGGAGRSGSDRARGFLLEFDRNGRDSRRSKPRFVGSSEPDVRVADLAARGESVVALRVSKQGSTFHRFRSTGAVERQRLPVRLSKGAYATTIAADRLRIHVAGTTFARGGRQDVFVAGGR